jgi:hypothetical protein
MNTGLKMNLKMKITFDTDTGKDKVIDMDRDMVMTWTRTPRNDVQIFVSHSVIVSLCFASLYFA